ncbi:hypothetical protein C0993_002315 [Termitomyces sp. T159_Od127]|nr:hypothetical protein C0993_002315 [Termitomyces sp. T159_Od127]
MKNRENKDGNTEPLTKPAIPPHSHSLITPLKWILAYSWDTFCTSMALLRFPIACLCASLILTAGIGLLAWLLLSADSPITFKLNWFISLVSKVIDQPEPPKTRAPGEHPIFAFEATVLGFASSSPSLEIRKAEAIATDIASRIHSSDFASKEMLIAICNDFSLDARSSLQDIENLSSRIAGTLFR